VTVLRRLGVGGLPCEWHISTGFEHQQLPHSRRRVTDSSRRVYIRVHGLLDGGSVRRKRGDQERGSWEWDRKQEANGKQAVRLLAFPWPDSVRRESVAG
jgi:hypothetical protein